MTPEVISLSDRRHRLASTTKRGYGSAHQRIRRRIANLVSIGKGVCARCGNAISPFEPWDLDHSDDRTAYLGPSHRRCNRGHRQVRRQTRRW